MMQFVYDLLLNITRMVFVIPFLLILLVRLVVVTLFDIIEYPFVKILIWTGMTKVEEEYAKARK